MTKGKLRAFAYKSFKIALSFLGTPLSTINYGYDNVWKDKLVSYNGTAITSDAMGNPLNAVSLNVIGGLEELEFEWNGRQLSAVTRNTQRYEYSYDSNGMRTEIREYKNGSLETVCHYAWQNGKLVGLDIRDGSGEVRYVVKMIYDNAGESTGYILFDEESSNQEVMHFQKNLQGDITGVFCENYGCKVLSYKYDAWGNITPQIIGTSGTMLYWSDIALLLTPITYRGYMYDPYIGMYYLQSRYYNPAYGRFLNVDDTDILEASQGTTHGANLFAYCNNNPVMNVDYGGREPISLFLIVSVIGFILLFIVIISQLNKNSGNSNDKIKNVLKLIKKFKELHDLKQDYWLAFYYHAKNVVEYGTRVNVNPTFPYYEEFDYPHPYTVYCHEAYMYLDFYLLDRNERWSNMSTERRLEIMRSMAWYDENMYKHIITYFAESFYTWGTETYEIFWGIVKDLGTV